MCASHNILNLDRAYLDIERHYQHIAQSQVLPLSVGGDHSVTYPILKALREAQRMIRELSGLNFAGGDMVEVAPSLDPSGSTALNGATILFEILCVMATSRFG